MASRQQNLGQNMCLFTCQHLNIVCRLHNHPLAVDLPWGWCSYSPLHADALCCWCMQYVQCNTCSMLSAGEQAAALKSLAEKCRIPVVVTNQVRSPMSCLLLQIVQSMCTAATLSISVLCGMIHN